MVSNLKSIRDNTKLRKEREPNPNLDNIVCILSESLNAINKINYEKNINLSVILYDTVKKEQDAFKILNNINAINFKDSDEWKQFNEKEKIVKDFLSWYYKKMEVEWLNILSSGFMNVIHEISNEISNKGLLENETSKMDFIEEILNKERFNSNKIHFDKFKSSL